MGIQKTELKNLNADQFAKVIPFYISATQPEHLPRILASKDFGFCMDVMRELVNLINTSIWHEKALYCFFEYLREYYGVTIDGFAVQPYDAEDYSCGSCSSDDPSECTYCRFMGGNARNVTRYRFCRNDEQASQEQLLQLLEELRKKPRPPIKQADNAYEQCPHKYYPFSAQDDEIRGESCFYCGKGYLCHQ
ncbi:hypothetical protein LJC56_11275 [Christensenellaceae bacterium OttesenSCG-928-K19]|nr:hypothetical protein [Christensenellaceae bacterium OttesenSCG-928-K19]